MPEPPQYSDVPIADDLDNPAVEAGSLLNEETAHASEPQKLAPSDTLLKMRLPKVLVLILLIASVGLIASVFVNKVKNTTKNAANVSADYTVQQIPLTGFIATAEGETFTPSNVVINGALTANNGVVVAPTPQPVRSVAGQMYFDQNTNQLAYYNGTAYIPLGAQPQAVQSVGGVSGALTLGAGLNITGNQLSVVFPQVAAAALPDHVSSLGGGTGVLSVGRGLAMNGSDLQNSGVLSVTAGTPNLTVTSDGQGNLTISNIGGGSGTVTSAGGTSGRIAKFTGVQNIEDSLLSESGPTVTVNGNLSITGSITLSSPLSVANGGTGATTLATNGVLVGQGASALTSVTAAGSGLCLMSTAGVPSFQACPAAGGVTSLNLLTGALTIANATTAGSTITLDDATTAGKGIASFNSTNFTVSSGAVNTIQNIHTAAAPVFGQLALTSSQATNPMLLVNNTNGSATGNLLDLQISGVSRFSVQPGGNALASGTLTSGVANSQTGALVLAYGSANFSATVTPGTLTANRTYTLPDADGTLCLNGSSTCGFATGSGAAFVNGGNNFGGAANLGTNSNDILNLRTNGVTRIAVAADGSQVTLASNTDLVMQGTTAHITNDQGTTAGESFGAGAVTSNRSTGVGYSAAATGNDAVAVGYNAVGNNLGTAVGAESTVSNTGGTAIGAGAEAAYQAVALGTNAVAFNGSVVLGGGASATSMNSIALGTGAVATASNQMVIGSDGYEIDHLYIGSGVADASPTSFTLQGTGGSGSNVAGASVTIAGGAGTGTANGGNINLQIAAPGVSGSAANVPATVFSLSGNDGSVLFKNITNSTTALNVQTAGGASVFAVDTSATASRGIAVSGAVTATGVVDLQGGAVTIGTTSQAASLTLWDGSANTSTIQTAALGSNQVYTLPTAGGTICIQNSVSCGFVAGTTSDFIQNQNASQQASSSFWVSGASRIDNTLTVPTVNTAASDLTIQTSSSTRATFSQSSYSLFLGNGITSATPSGFTVAATGSSAVGVGGSGLVLQGGAGAATGTGSSGGDITIAGGNADGSGNNFGGTVILQGGAATGTGANGGVVVKNSANMADAFRVLNAANNPVFKVDTSAGIVGVNGRVDIDGALNLTGTAVTTFTTPALSSVLTKINIPLFDPGDFGQVVALGLPSGAYDTARVLSLFDNRAGDHQQTLAVFSPDESTAVGFSWNGSNTQAYVQTTSQASGNTDGIVLQSGNVTTGAGGSGSVVVTSGYVSGASGYSSGNVVLQSGNGTGTNTSSGNVTIDTGTKTGTGTVGTINIGTANATTINIGNPSISQSLNVGSINGSSTTTIAAGTGNLNLRTDSASAGTIVRTLTDSATAFEVRDSVDVPILSVDTAANHIELNGTATINETLTLGDGLTGAGLTDCDGTNSKLLWDATTQMFSCGTDKPNVIVRKSTAQTNSTTTPVTDNAFSFTMGANETWAFQISTTFSGSVNAMNPLVNITGPSGATCNLQYTDLYMVINYSATACNDPFVPVHSDTNDNQYLIWGTVVTGATPGTVNLEFARDVSSPAGTITHNAGGYIVAYKLTGADLAEAYQTKDATIAPGHVVSVDGSLQAGVKKSQGAYDAKVLGIVSTNPGYVLGDPALTPEGRPVLLALSGRVPLRVSMENGPIEAGDYLTASSTPGVAMKATRPGQMIGKALENFSGARADVQGMVMTLANLTWANPSSGVEANDDLQGATAVSGDLNISGTLTTENLTVTGTATIRTLNVGTMKAGSIDVAGTAAIGGDLAFQGAGQKQNAITKQFVAAKAIAAGDIVVIDTGHEGWVTTTTVKDDTRVVGVAVTATGQAGDTITIAIGGTVQIRTALGVSLQAGDLLSTSIQPGAAGKAEAPVPGAVAGKALGKPEGDGGLVWAIVTLD